MATPPPAAFSAQRAPERFERVVFSTFRPQVAQPGDPVPDAAVRALEYLRALPFAVRVVSVSETETPALHRIVIWIEHPA